MRWYDLARSERRIGASRAGRHGALRRGAGARRRRPDRRRGADLRSHRAERGRQDHAVQLRDRPLSAAGRDGPLRRATTCSAVPPHGIARARASPARSRTSACSPDADACATTCWSARTTAAGPGFGTRGALPGVRREEAELRAEADALLDRLGLDRGRRPPGGRAAVRHAQAGGAGPGAAGRTRGCCCSTSRPTGSTRRRSTSSPSDPAAARRVRPDACCWSSTTWASSWAICDQVVVPGASAGRSPRARPPRSSATRRRRGLPGDGRRTERCWRSPTARRAGYGERPGAARARALPSTGGEIVRDPRAPTGPARPPLLRAHLRHGAPARARPVRRHRRHRPRRPTRSPGSASRHVPEGRGTFSRLTVEENLRARRLRSPGPARGEAPTSTRCCGCSRGWASASRQARRQPQRRRAADAGDRAGR